MEKFIEKTSYKLDLEKLTEEYKKVIDAIGWPKKIDAKGKTLSSNQIGLNHRPGAVDKWLDNVGSLYDSKTNTFLAKESDFIEFNSALGNYTKSILNDLAEKENFILGRVRYMRLPEKTGLTVHRDLEQRYHIVIETHPAAYFGETIDSEELAAKCYHIPADGHVYKVDSTKDHFVYNGGRKDRIHLVICPVDSV